MAAEQLQPNVSSTNPALARQRRKERLLSQRVEDHQFSTAPSDHSVIGKHEMPNEVTERARKKPRLNPTEITKSRDSGKEAKKSSVASTGSIKESRKDNKGPEKNQFKYEPDVPMSKEELKAWRKEQRRVRNRESAAASRQKIRDRIEELESEVNELKTKYAAAIKRLSELEGNSSGASTGRKHVLGNGGHFAQHTPFSGCNPVTYGVVSPCTSPVLSPKSCSTLPYSPSSLIVSHHTCQEGYSQKGEEKQHLIESISRPKA